MRIKQFEYHAPYSLEEACSVLTKHQGSASVLAGGTDLLVDLKEETVRWDHLVSLKNIAVVRKIEFDEKKGLTIGAATPLNRVAKSGIVKKMYPGLAEAAASVAGEQIRNRGTIGGNICSAVPSADVPPILLAMNCELKLMSTDGERMLPLSKFFLGPRRTVLGRNEVLVSIYIPAPSEHTGTSYIKFGLRNASALAVVGVAARVVMEGNVCREGNIALGAVAPTPLLATRASEALSGKELDDACLNSAAETAAAECSPISDIRGSADYRRELVRTLVTRAIALAVTRAQRDPEELKAGR